MGLVTEWMVTGGGVRLAFHRIGTGRPLVVFHGRAGDSREWTDEGPADALVRAGHQVIAVDFRGHGASDRPTNPEAYPPDVLATDALALIDHLGLKPGGWDLAGYSLGGRVALRALVRGAQPRRAAIGGQSDAILSAATEVAGEHRVALDAMISGHPLPTSSAGAAEADRLASLGAIPRALLGVLTSLPATHPGELATITTPTLIAVHRGSDVTTLAAALPHSIVTQIPGDHFTALGQPEFAATLNEYFN